MDSQRRKQIELAYWATRRWITTTNSAWFDLTMDEFIALWEPHWERRKTDKLMLTRADQAGPYNAANARIDTRSNHMKAYWAERRREEDSKIAALTAAWQQKEDARRAANEAELQRLEAEHHE